MFQVLCLSVVLGVSSFLYAQQSHADIVMRVNVQAGSLPEQSFDIRLFDEIAPVTVDNFLRYTEGLTQNGGSYQDIFFHRLIPGFVIQTGGFYYNAVNGAFTYDEVSDTYNGGLGPVTQDPSIVNEFDLSNTRGTLAMAKLAGNADSATSQWFINLADNSMNLDAQNGGFAVFAEVMGAGMTVVDQLSSATVVDKSDVKPVFSSLPLIDYTNGQSVDDSHLVKLSGFTKLLQITGDIDFGIEYTNSITQKTITIDNVSGAAITLPAIALDDGTVSALTIIQSTDMCSNKTLSPNDSCTFEIEFAPEQIGVFMDRITVSIPELNIVYPLNIRARAEDEIRPVISPNRQVMDFGDVTLVDDPSAVVPKQLIVLVYNEGNVDLNITSAGLSGVNSDSFEIFDNCKIVSPIAPGDRCVLPVNLYALELGDKSALITILSDDPSEPIVEIPITASVSEDVDGVPSSIEDAVNSYSDGNYDGIADRRQSNVASLLDGNNKPVTIVSDSLFELNDVTLNAVMDSAGLPDGINIEYGAIDFSITDDFGVGLYELGIVLETLPQTGDVYVQVPLSGLGYEWRKFDYDGETGLHSILSAQFTTEDANVVQRQLILLRLKDGGRGDLDGQENGIIRLKLIVSANKSRDPVGVSDVIALFSLVFVLVMLRGIRYFGVRRFLH